VDLQESPQRGRQLSLNKASGAAVVESAHGVLRVISVPVHIQFESLTAPEAPSIKKVCSMLAPATVRALSAKLFQRSEPV
jgi:hypothetical protein